jgi:hypothetical protein
MDKPIEEGQELTLTFPYGEPICNTCEHQEKMLNEYPCNKCSVVACYWEPKKSESED